MRLAAEKRLERHLLSKPTEPRVFSTIVRALGSFQN
jgi:hypothetical protein